MSETALCTTISAVEKCPSGPAVRALWPRPFSVGVSQCYTSVYDLAYGLLLCFRCPLESSRDSWEVLSLAACAWARSPPPEEVGGASARTSPRASPLSRTSRWGSVEAEPGCHCCTSRGDGTSMGVGSRGGGLFRVRLLWGSRQVWPMAPPLVSPVAPPPPAAPAAPLAAPPAAPPPVLLPAPPAAAAAAAAAPPRGTPRFNRKSIRR